MWFKKIKQSFKNLEKKLLNCTFATIKSAAIVGALTSPVVFYSCFPPSVSHQRTEQGSSIKFNVYNLILYKDITPVEKVTLQGEFPMIRDFKINDDSFEIGITNARVNLATSKIKVSYEQNFIVQVVRDYSEIDRLYGKAQSGEIVKNFNLSEISEITPIGVIPNQKFNVSINNEFINLYEENVVTDENGILKITYPEAFNYIKDNEEGLKKFSNLPEVSFLKGACDIQKIWKKIPTKEIYVKVEPIDKSICKLYGEKKTFSRPIGEIPKSEIEEIVKKFYLGKNLRELANLFGFDTDTDSLNYLRMYLETYGWKFEAGKVSKVGKIVGEIYTQKGTKYDEKLIEEFVGSDIRMFANKIGLKPELVKSYLENKGWEFYGNRVVKANLDVFLSSEEEDNCEAMKNFKVKFIGQDMANLKEAIKEVCF